MRLLRPPERRLLLLCAALLCGAGAAYVHRGGVDGLRTAPAIVVQDPPVYRTEDTLRSRETVAQLFARRGVSDVDWSAVAAAVRAFNPARLRSGLVFTFDRRHGERAPHAVAVRFSPEERLHLVRPAAGAGWEAELERIAWHTDLVRLEGVILANLYQAMDDAAGAEALPAEARKDLVFALADVYDWVVDFSRDVQPGDRVLVLAERRVSAEGDVRAGRVLAARLDVGPRPLYAFRFDAPEGRVEYYDERGRSMKRDLLRAPLEYRRIASGFSRSRFHPILRYRRPHNGLDFSAAYGAPVRAVGDGLVTQAGRAGGYGNLVEIKHSGNRTSRYAHLSSFAAGIHVGARVRQGQTIGRVGASGLATSAHLHYELIVNGRFVNPRRQFPAGEGQPIASSRRQAFEGEKARLLEILEPRSAAEPRMVGVDD